MKKEKETIMLNDRKECPYLHVLRVFACVWVVAVHWEQRVRLPEVLHKLCAGGSWGPIIFFVLSGFLTFPSLERELEMHERGGYRSWLVKRAVRLLLLYYVVILFYFVFYTVIDAVPVDETRIGWFRYIFLINDCIPSENTFWTNVGAVWTVSAFMSFDLLVPIWYKCVRSYRTACVGVVAMLLLAESIAHFTDWFHTLQCFYYFALGILAHFAVKEHREHHLFVLGNAVLLLWFVITGSCEVGMLAMMLIVAASELTMKNETCIRWFRIFSRYSYSVYLIHAAVLVVLDQVYRGSAAILYTIMFLVATGLCCFGAYQLIEKRIGGSLVFILNHRDEEGRLNPK